MTSKVLKKAPNVWAIFCGRPGSEYEVGELRYFKTDPERLVFYHTGPEGRSLGTIQDIYNCFELLNEDLKNKRGEFANGKNEEDLCQ